MSHNFAGKWITDSEFANLEPRNVFHRQLEKVSLPCQEHRNRHILFRRTFVLPTVPQNARLYISADDYYKLFINGEFAGQGPAPSYHFQYNYNVIDLTPFLREGNNTLAVHTLYQGLINRVWQSGDFRHGLIFDICDGDTVLLASDETVKTHPHTGYRETGICGYQTQFLEAYDSRSPEASFAAPDFDDSGWEFARYAVHDDHVMVEQKSHSLVVEEVAPVSVEKTETGIRADFGSQYVGYLNAVVRGTAGQTVTVRCGQERNDDRSIREKLRANCVYEEDWILADGESCLCWFDYKAFRYAELTLPEGVELISLSFSVRHYPFTQKGTMRPEYAEDADLRRVWELCVNTQKYGVQEVIQDCMEREKGFYLGDGCYTALTHYLLTHDDSMMRKLIDDAFATSFITDTLVTCMDCSFMQEIAEYPLILVFLVLWHYRFTEDRAYLRTNYEKVRLLLDAYRREYESDGLLRHLDKWSVVEWPANFRHGYDVDLTEGRVCHDAHVALNAYYLAAIRTANTIAEILGCPSYRDETPVREAFYGTFYRPDSHLFRDGEHTDHISLVGNSFVLGFGLCPDPECEAAILTLYESHGIASLSLFCTFPMLLGLLRLGRLDLIRQALTDEGAWLRILREGGTTTFEGWGKDTKWNTSLFHLTMSYAAVFLCDTEIQKLLL